MSYLVRFCRFWYDFIVGDDWTVALTVVVAVAATFAVAHQGGLAWWILPVAVAGTLGASVLRARRAKHGNVQDSRKILRGPPIPSAHPASRARP